MTSSWFSLSTLNYDARSATHQIRKLMFDHFLYLSHLNLLQIDWQTFSLFHIEIAPFMFVGLNIPTSSYFILLKMIHIQRHRRKTFFFKTSTKPHSGTQACKRPHSVFTNHMASLFHVFSLAFYFAFVSCGIWCRLI